MTSPAPVRVAKWLGILYALALLLHGAAGGMLAERETYEWPMLFLFTAWQVGPVAAAAILAKASRTRRSAWLFVLLEATLVASTIWFFIDVRVNRDTWTSVGGSMFFAFVGPFYQYVAVVASFILASAFGWRAREEWLKA